MKQYGNYLKVELSAEVARIYKELTGRGPKKVKVAVKEDMLIVRYEAPVNNVLEILKTRDEKTLNRLRETLFDYMEENIQTYVSNHLQCEVKETHFSHKSKHNEAVIVFILEEIIEP